MDEAGVETASGTAELRRLTATIGVVVLLDTALYAVLGPLLPSLAHQLHLSKLSAGFLTASYAIGTLAGSLPSGVLVVRLGPKVAVFLGLSMLLAATVAFAFLENVVALDIARLIEGLGGALSWTGGLAWIVNQTPPERRGGALGRAVSAAVAGALLGPVLGTIATVVGRPAAFSGLAVLVGALLFWLRRMPSTHVRSDQGVGHLFGALRSGAIAAPFWLVTLPAIAAGLINVLAPLRIHRFGGSALVIGATFVVSAAIEATIAPLVGSLSDRRGRLLPIRVGLMALGVALLGFTVPSAVAPLAVVVATVLLTVGFFWAPAMAMLTDAASAMGLDQGLAVALINIAWALGQIIGSAGGGAVAKSTGDRAPTVILAGVCVATLIGIARMRASGPGPAVGRGPLDA